MSSVLNIVKRNADDVSIIELHGDVNSDGDAAIKGAYHDAVAAGARTVLFNMSKTEYINTSGISVLIAVVMEAKKAGHKILVSGVSTHYKKVFDLVRFSVYVTMFDTEEAALASLKAPAQPATTQSATTQSATTQSATEPAKPAETAPKPSGEPPVGSR